MPQKKIELGRLRYRLIVDKWWCTHIKHKSYTILINVIVGILYKILYIKSNEWYKLTLLIVWKLKCWIQETVLLLCTNSWYVSFSLKAGNFNPPSNWYTRMGRIRTTESLIQSIFILVNIVWERRKDTDAY